jgi:hypothetical protein
MPKKEFEAFTRLDASDVNTYLMDQSVMTFDTAASRDSAIDSPVEGQVTYLQDFDRLSVYNGTQWVTNRPIMTFAGTAARGSAIPAPVESMAAFLNDSDTLSIYDGTNWKTSLATTGGILQVVSAIKVDAFSSSSVTFTDITGLSVSITPKSATSKILVILNTYTSLSQAGDTLVNLVRNSTALSQPNFGDAKATMVGRVNDHAGIANTTTAFLDEPATTSATTYKAQMRVIAQTGFINRRGADTAFGLTSSITAIEVSA